MKKFLLTLLLPLCISADVLNCKVEQVLKLKSDGTLGEHVMFQPFMNIDSNKHFSVDTSSGKISGVILVNDRSVMSRCSIDVNGGGDDDTVITSNCGGQVEYIRISTWEKNNPFIAVDFIKGVYSGTCKGS